MWSQVGSHVKALMPAVKGSSGGCVTARGTPGGSQLLWDDL